KSALNLVRDESSAVVRCQFARAIPKSSAQRENPALALKHFHHDRADGIIELGLEICRVIKTHELNPWQQRSEWLPIFHRMRDGERTRRAAVEGILQSKNASLFLSAA